MIDIETEVFSIVSAEVRKKYPKIYMTGEYVKSPPSFPCVSLIETDNQVYRNTRDSGCIENHAQVLYEVNVYSNKTSGKKTECKAIIALIDSKMEALGFTRTLPAVSSLRICGKQCRNMLAARTGRMALCSLLVRAAQSWWVM